MARTVRNAAIVGAAAAPFHIAAGQESAVFRAGEGVVDITPPMDIELAGFHRPVGNERRIETIRKNTAVRALVLQHGESSIAIISIDILAVSDTMAKRVGAAVEARTGIPAANVRLCATHTHSMPSFKYLRQWGAIPEAYMAGVEAKAVDAVALALADVVPAALHIGNSRTNGANFNRTTPEWKTDADFVADSNDDGRWLDTELHVLHIERTAGKQPLLWYHFSAHPVCYADESSGPDWCGLLDDLVRTRFDVTPSFLQGHAGDVNPGDGDPWRGEAEQTASAVFAGIEAAMNNVRPVKVNELRVRTQAFGVPCDLALREAWVHQFATDPTACTQGPWVDEGFAKAWFDANRERTALAATHPINLSVIQVGDVALAFHPSELFSYYGLRIRHDSPFTDTLVTGYTDDFIGYLTDPSAYQNGEYAAVVVPKILDFPPFTRAAAADMTAAISRLLRETAA